MSPSTTTKISSKFQTGIKTPKSIRQKTKKKTQDITMSPLIFHIFLSSNSTHQLHTQKNTLPGRGSCHASLLGWSWGCSNFSRCPYPWRYVFFFRKKMVPFSVDITSGTWERVHTYPLTFQSTFFWSPSFFPNFPIRRERVG